MESLTENTTEKSSVQTEKIYNSNHPIPQQPVVVKPHNDNSALIIVLVVGSVFLLPFICIVVSMVIGYAVNKAEKNNYYDDEYSDTYYDDTDIIVTADPSVTPTEEIELTPTPQTNFYKNDDIKLDGLKITVGQIIDNTETAYLKPNPENKFMSIEVTVENTINDDLYISPLSFSLKDESNYKYFEKFGIKDPKFQFANLAPGEKIKGFVSFEVPKKSSKYELVYDSSSSNTDPIYIKLENRP